MLELGPDIAFASCRFGLYRCLCLRLGLLFLHRLVLISHFLTLKPLGNYSYLRIFNISINLAQWSTAVAHEDSPQGQGFDL